MATNEEYINGVCYVMIAVVEKSLRDMAYAISTIRENDSSKIRIIAIIHGVSNTDILDYVRRNSTVLTLKPYLENVYAAFGNGLDGRLTAMYSKLFIPTMGFFDGFDRVVYLDSDIKVQGSLKTLRTMKVARAMAACLDGFPTLRARYNCCYLPMPRLNEEELSSLARPLYDDSAYVNTGVIVFDTSRMPFDYKKRIFNASDYVRRVGHTSAVDQDIFNMEFDFDVFGNEYNHDPHIGATEETPILHYFGSHHKEEFESIVSKLIKNIH